MDLEYYIQHPEQMDKETLYDLRSLLALYPYYQTARLLMLQNLYLLHDPTFDEELRRAAVYLTDRKTIFNLVEAAHYNIIRCNDKDQGVENKKKDNDDRTSSLIDKFLDSLPTENETEKKKRKPTPADAAIDYVAYLIETEEENAQAKKADEQQMFGHSLIDDFIKNDRGRIELKEELEYMPPQEEDDSSDENNADEGYFTETLARIYIKQGRYSKALEIIKRLNLNYPKKNAYFADQIRFLEKLIINNNKKQK